MRRRLWNRVKCALGRHKRIRVFDHVEPLEMNASRKLLGLSFRVTEAHYECQHCKKRLP